MELALFYFGVHLVLDEPLKDHSNVLYMVGQSVRIDKNVVDIDNYRLMEMSLNTSFMKD